MNLGLGRPRRRHNSGNWDPERALVPSLPAAVRLPSGLRCLRRAGAGTSETGKAAKELARVPLSHQRHCPTSSQRPAPGAPRLRARPRHRLQVSQGQRPQSLRRPRLISLDVQPRPPTDFALYSNFLLLGQSECPPGALVNSESQGLGEPTESGTSSARPKPASLCGCLASSSRASSDFLPSSQQFRCESLVNCRSPEDPLSPGPSVLLSGQFIILRIKSNPSVHL